MGAVHLLGRSIIPTEDADLGFLLIPRRLLAHLSLHAEKVETGEAPSKTGFSVLLWHAGTLVLERAKNGEALFQVEDGGRRRTRGRAAAFQVSTFAAAPDNARARRRIVQAQSRFQRLRDGIGTLGRAVLVLRDQRRETQIVVPEIECVVVRGASVQIVVI